jgi:hypothetical protein
LFPLGFPRNLERLLLLASSNSKLIGLKTKMLTAIILGMLSALLLAQATFTLFPTQEQSMPPPMPQAETTSQLVWSLQWLGFALLVSFLIVGAILMVKRVRQQRTSPDIAQGF